MGHRLYTAQYKTRIVLEILQGEKELGEIAAENNLNPNMIRNWKEICQGLFYPKCALL